LAQTNSTLSIPAGGGTLPPKLYQFPALIERYDVSLRCDLFGQIACGIADATADFQNIHVGPRTGSIAHRSAVAG
jgi:hypothetical protein